MREVSDDAAFPVSTIDGDTNTGMLLRDYFAAKALGVMCSSNVNATGTFATPDGRDTIAKVCYAMADAMLAARVSPAKPGSECSGDPTSCPENEGYGCLCSNRDAK